MHCLYRTMDDDAPAAEILLGFSHASSPSRAISPLVVTPYSNNSSPPSAGTSPSNKGKVKPSSYSTGEGGGKDAFSFTCRGRELLEPFAGGKCPGYNFDPCTAKESEKNPNSSGFKTWTRVCSKHTKIRVPSGRSITIHIDSIKDKGLDYCQNFVAELMKPFHTVIRSEIVISTLGKTSAISISRKFILHTNRFPSSYDIKVVQS
jgi:hypothetical protein